ncbi:MAG: alanyl-tRNA editing protein, partial [Acutalibacteraceae bacterium]|nr:alanyl-tRNA editing protein [Acutalibacteraceae bacterium]
MTEKLYDSNAYSTRFTAQVISCIPCEKGYKVILDKTAFFPEEGGQYSDRGTLSGANVFDVQLENGEIVHYTDKPVKDLVDGEIDFDRRFRNMQNHTGEHIISGLIHSLFGGENVGFHLGEDEVTCDYDIELNSQQLALIELEANKAVYRNLSVKGYYPQAEKLKEIPYRSKKEIEEAVRIVEIEDIDCCACCAPHVKSTSEIGIIKILSYMRLRGGCRLFIVCGLDAFMDYSLKHKEIKAISAL